MTIIFDAHSQTYMDRPLTDSHRNLSLIDKHIDKPAQVYTVGL